MGHDLRGDGPKNIWLNQPTETRTMTMQLIQQKSRELRARTRRKLVASVVGPLAVGLFYAYSMKEFAPLRQVLQPMFAFAFVWSVAGLYFLNRGMWSAVTPADVGLSTGLEFCRREIKRQRDLVSRILLWSSGPLLLAIGTFILALVMVGTAERGIFPNGLPFLISIVAWIVCCFMVRLREQRELQREIDELNDIEKENQRL
jgi:hypothetical protein